MLLEREGALEAVRAAFGAVLDSGRGRFVVVGGEAGVGKTSLLRHVADEFADDARVLWGVCDSLSTPRALGPLTDIAAQVGGELADLLASDAARDTVFAATLRGLSEREQPTVVMIEDTHWADEATVDFLTFVRRRIDTTSALVLVSYRDDEIGPGHPLRFVLGDTSVRDEVRLHLAPLTVEAVATLAAGRDVDPAEVHRITGGNSFFVTEVLAVGDEGGAAPPTVRDAVLARAGRLPPEARAVLDAIAIVPVRCELWLLDRLVDDPAQVPAVDDCVATGVLRPDGDGVIFRHELARLAVRDAVAPIRRRALHERALVALAEPPSGSVDEARLAHHAFEAGDADAVLDHAPVAAAHAARVGAHTQAAAHLEHAIRYVGRLPVAEQIDLWFRLANEQVVVGRMDDAVASMRTAIDLCRASGDRAQEGLLLIRLGTVHTSAGDQPEATRRIAEGLAVLEPLGPTAEYAYGLAIRSSQHMLAREFADAELWGRRAIALCEDVGRTDYLVQALLQSGIALLMSGDDAGHDRILRGMDLARELGMDSHVSLSYSHIGSGAGEVRRYSLAVPALEAGIAYARERELLGGETYMVAWLARCHLDQGRWREAEHLCTDVLANPRLVGIARMVAVTVLGRLRSRRGDPGVWDALDESLAVARENGHLQRLWPTAVARPEAAWLAGHLESEVPVLREAHELAASVEYPWALGELALWLTRAGERPTTTSPAAEPVRLSLEGRHGDAAAAWEALGCPIVTACRSTASPRSGSSTRTSTCAERVEMRRHTALLVAAATLTGGVLSGATAAGAEPTCLPELGIDVHGQHIVGDYVTGIHGDLDWPPSGGVVGDAVAGEGAALAGGPGPGFHFPNGFAPGASFCNDQSNSPGVHF